MAKTVQPPAARRPLKIYAFDPMLGRMPLNRITIDIQNEPLRRGPAGSRIEVVDYDGANDCFYEPVDLDDKAILMQGGLDPSESDPRFHQQMVYAVSMKVLENFERALGRKITFRGRKLRIFPHAFEGRNAFYDPNLHALLFGYFRADRDSPGPNLPGQPVFSCLSHDIVAHEMTHALVHRLRKHFFERTNHDVGAFHEGFSDIVAIFQHFSFPEILRDRIQRTRGDLRKSDAFVELAAEFGYATGKGEALRSAIQAPNPRRYHTVFEAHDRGSILVAAVFEAFFTTYQRRIADLVRIATGGTGQLPAGDMHPDLVNRIAEEATRTAQSILTMCIRAFEYLPPVDITFGDFLRALVTADYELAPQDKHGQRQAMIEAFRVRGIYPDHVSSLSEESVLYETAGLEPLGKELVGHLALAEYVYGGAPTSDAGGSEVAPALESEEEKLPEIVASQLRKYARKNAAALGLDAARVKQIQVLGFHPAFRVNSHGGLVMELVAQFTQRADLGGADLGGMEPRAGTTLIAAADGTVRYAVTKPLPGKGVSEIFHDVSKTRFDRHQAFVADSDLADAHLPWADASYLRKRMGKLNLSSLHLGLQS
jgi:murein DD-endopeptidase MepM/ murein hydrolase activator NlpD